MTFKLSIGATTTRRANLGKVLVGLIFGLPLYVVGGLLVLRIMFPQVFDFIFGASGGTYP